MYSASVESKTCTSDSDHKSFADTAKVDPIAQLKLSNSDLLPNQKAELFNLLETYRDQFSTSSSDIGNADIVKHSVDVGDHPPIKQKAYRIPESQKTKVSDLITAMLKQGVIRPSNSPWASPIVIVRKKDGSDRFCIDFRKLNSITRKDAFPLPNITEILDQLGKAQLFSSLDLASGNLANTNE